jgi:hypothetical protein
MAARDVVLLGSIAALGAAVYLASRADAPLADAGGFDPGPFSDLSGAGLAGDLSGLDFSGGGEWWDFGALYPGGDAAGGQEEEEGDIPQSAFDAIVGPAFDAITDAVRDPVGLVDDAIFALVGHRVMGARWLDAAAKPENAAFVAAMHAAESRYGIPGNLVVRVAWQESRFNPRAHNRRSNATGIMQIVPRWHPYVDAWDPLASIDYGAKYLSQLYRQFGSWELALKAYNWGPGNLKKWQAGKLAEPTETSTYSRQILADLGATGQVLA